MRISCICPTIAGRETWLAQAIAAFHAQSHRDKELIILADKDCTIPNYRGPGHVIVARASGKLTTGTKRNGACQLATGDIIAHWDDDDYSAPFRLSSQLNTLLNCGRQVVGYHSMLYTDGANWYEYRGHTQDTMGTSLMFYRSYWEQHRFADLRVGEDVDFVLRACRERQLYASAAGDAMYATIHAGNTCARNVIIDGERTSWRRAKGPKVTC